MEKYMEDSLAELQHHKKKACSVDNNLPDWLTEQHETGTSIIAMEFDGGVILGADSRTTTGAYVANRVSDKLDRITDRIYCCRSGSAADTQAISRIVNYHLGFHEMELGQAPLVATGANIFRKLCYEYRDQLKAGIIVAGWDRKLGGQVYCIPLGGMLMRQPISIGGSGSSYIYGFVDANFREGMKKEEAKQFVARALSHAMYRDGSSGGIIRLCAITEDAVERFFIPGDKLPFM